LAPPPPVLTSAAYATAYNEAKNFGGDGITTPTQRTAEQTFIGTFWAYDGTPSLCAPPRLYNQITVHIADQTKLKPVELARLLALVNVSMADTAMTTWDSKYHYDFWRPITAIRESDPGTGPTGAGDGNNATIGDPTFTALGAPASNLVGPNFTPPFPAYPSGHAGFGGAVLKRFAGFMERIKSGLLSFLMNSTAQRKMTRGTFVPTCRAAFLRCHRPKKKTVKAEFISASIGASIRRPVSRKADTWLTTCSITLFSR
jgi:hypothetical protein